MTFTLPADLPEDWVDNIGMVEDADYLNKVGGMGNAIKAALLAIVSGATGAVVAASESTTSTSYVDLTTTTDSVAATIGASGKALVIMSALFTTGPGGTHYMGYAMSGANTAAATDAKCVAAWTTVNTAQVSASGVFLETGLTPGSTTFKAKYKSNVNGCAFSNRRLAVIPFP